MSRPVPPTSNLAKSLARARESAKRFYPRSPVMGRGCVAPMRNERTNSPHPPLPPSYRFSIECTIGNPQDEPSPHLPVVEEGLRYKIPLSLSSVGRDQSRSLRPHCNSVKPIDAESPFSSRGTRQCASLGFPNPQSRRRSAGRNAYPS